MNYYNDFDKGAAAWLRQLIKEKLIPDGVVDERSITEITPADLAGFTQCHFFCGIAGWPLALQLAGIPASQPLWTGSPPCQPFSVAGKQLGRDDPRHLAPAFLELIAQCRPQLLFGEQVAAAIGKHWLDALLIELEEQGYACGASVLPAASVGAPHKRDRLFFGAHQLADTTSARHLRSESATFEKGQQQEPGYSGKLQARPGGRTIPDIQQGAGVGSMADADNTRPQGRGGVPERPDQQSAGAAGLAGSMANPDSEQQRQVAESGQRNEYAPSGRAEDSATAAGLRSDNPTNSHNSFWSGADWLGCRDGKFRPVEPGTFPLANGIPARVGRLRGYGNAIVPQVAAEFIKAFTGAITDAGN